MTTENANVPDELPPLPTIPWATVASAVLALLLFGGLLAFILIQASDSTEIPPALSGEQQLQELRQQESAILESDGWDPDTKTWHIPIDRAMEALIEQGKAKGDMQSFPVSPKQPMPEK